MAQGHIEFTLSVRVLFARLSVCHLCIQESCPAHIFVLHGGIKNLFDANEHHDKTKCRMQEPCH